MPKTMLCMDERDETTVFFCVVFFNPKEVKIKINKENVNCSPKKILYGYVNISGFIFIIIIMSNKQTNKQATNKQTKNPMMRFHSIHCQFDPFVCCWYLVYTVCVFYMMRLLIWKPPPPPYPTYSVQSFYIFIIY